MSGFGLWLDQAAVDEHERPRDLGVGGGEDEGDVAAPGVADDGRALQAERIDDGADVAGHLVEGEAVTRSVAEAVATLIERDDVEARREPCGDVVPDARVGGQPVKQDDRGTIAHPLANPKRQSRDGQAPLLCLHALTSTESRGVSVPESAHPWPTLSYIGTAAVHASLAGEIGYACGSEVAWRHGFC